MAGVVKPITIEKEYEKNPDISPEDIKKLRDWLKTQPHLPGEHLTDVDLLIAYHCCEKSSEVTKQVLDLHFTLRTLFTPFFKDRVFDKKAEFALNTVLCAPLVTPTAEGYRVVYLRLLDPEPRNFSLPETVRAFMMVFDLWQHEEGTWPGFVMLIDMDMATLSHVARLDLMVVKKVIYFLQECMFVKLKGVHFMSAPYFMDKVLMLIKPYLKKELMDIIHTHQVGSDSLYKMIPKKALPKEEGGEYKDHATLRDELLKRLQANPTFIREENKRRVNESLRKGGKPSQIEKEFGIQGSFKKLDID
ncbi:clavesin-1-like [Helicoverpa zea]|uniref:clavesin-1-like n=1 Tax=Helicoverpa zea TaxID=7113 RepID=UPI001F584CA3|nr:clavesin-1-like [Helicoverpa zea]